MQSFGLSIINGFGIGVGLILAAAFCRVALHLGMCP